MRFASLGSGSKGNATLIDHGGTRILLDCGFSVVELKRRLARLQVEAESISAVLITHEHGDHVRGAATLARQYDLPVFATAGTARAAGLQELSTFRLLRCQQSLALGDVEVLPVSVPHDAAEPCQYVFAGGGRHLGVLTDLGVVSPAVASAFGACDALVLEANHDRELLARGPYPAAVKRRVGGPWGHLSNEQAMAFLADVDAARLQHLVLAHISETNNHPERVVQALQRCPQEFKKVTYASQGLGADWIDIV